MLAANCIQRLSRKTLGRAFARWASGAVLAARQRRVAMRAVSVLGRATDAVLLRTALQDWFDHMRRRLEDRKRLFMLSDFEKEKHRLQREAEEVREGLRDERNAMESDLIAKHDRLRKELSYRNEALSQS